MDDDLYNFGDDTPSYANQKSTYSSNTNTYASYTPTTNTYSSSSSSSSSSSNNNATHNRRSQQNASSPGSTTITIDDNIEFNTTTTGPTTDHTPAAPPVSPVAEKPHFLGFCNVEIPPLTIQSDWKHGQQTKCMETQTDELRVTEADTQTATVRDSSCQTSEHGSGAGVDPKGTVFSGFEHFPSPEQSDLNSFLQRAGLELEKQLVRNDNSHAFDDYDLGNNNDDVSLTCLHVLAPTLMQNVKTVSQVLEEERRENDRHDRDARGGNSKSNSSSMRRAFSDGDLQGIDLQATSMSWNSTGSVLAVAYGRLDESGWCNITRAGCCLYHVFQRDFDAAKPQTFLETSSYLMSVCCHPEIPNLIVGGTFNGEVVVWDTSLEGEDRLIGTSAIDDYYHREPVVDVSWVYDVNTQVWNVVSISGEGKVLFWSVHNKCVHPIHGHLLAVKAKGKNSRVVAGGTCMSFQTNGKHSSSFVVGSEGGHLFRCSVREGRSKVQPPADAVNDGWTPEGWALLCRLRSSDRASVRQNAEQHARDNRLHSIGPSDIYASQPPQDKLFPSPIDFAYEAHVGPVHSISCSPFHRNLFLSCGADGSISLYSLLQAKPLLTLDPSPTYMMSVAWSKVRPLVFSATSEDGITFIYDLGTSLRQHVVEVNSSAASGDTSDSMGDKGGNSEYNSSRHRRPSTTCVAFNPRQRSLFATGNSNGTVHLWRLPPTLSTSVSNEDQSLEAIVRGLEDGDAIAAAKKTAARSKKAKQAKLAKSKKAKSGQAKSGGGGGGGGSSSGSGDANKK